MDEICAECEYGRLPHEGVGELIKRPGVAHSVDCPKFAWVDEVGVKAAREQIGGGLIVPICPCPNCQNTGMKHG